MKAVVLGSGIGGLVTTAVLARQFNSVELIEKDDQPSEPAIRAGVPQGNHFHGILPGGIDVLSDLFPGIDDKLIQAGSLTPTPEEFYVFMPEGLSYSTMEYQPEPSEPLPGFPSTYIQTRALLEHCVRKEVEAISNVTLRYASLVKDLLIDDKQVVGIRIDGSGEEVAADLVVDATGRVSRTVGWLKQLGFETAPEEKVECDFAYTTTFFRPNDINRFKDAGFFMAGDPESEHPRRGGALIRMENGDLLATIGGRLGDHPPRTLEGFYEWAKTMITPRFYELISDATPVSEPHHFKFPRSLRRRYDQLDQFPEGLIPIADAISHNNPVYGQGMSSACHQAVALGDCVRQRVNETGSLDGVWKTFFKEAIEQTRAPWLFAALADFGNEGTTGDFPMEEQTSIEKLMALRELAKNGSQQASIILASIGGMRRPLRTLHSDEVGQLLSSV